MTEGLHVVGLREVVRDLQAFGVEVDELKDANAQIAEEGASVMRGFTKVKSGTLRGSVRGNRAKGKAVVTAGRASVKYAGPQNYGWKRRNIAAQGFTAKTDARMAPVAVQLYESAVNDVISKRGLR